MLYLSCSVFLFLFLQDIHDIRSFYDSLLAAAAAATNSAYGSILVICLFFLLNSVNILDFYLEIFFFFFMDRWSVRDQWKMYSQLISLMILRLCVCDGLE